MKKLLLVAVCTATLYTPVFSASLSTNSTGYHWVRASSVERSNLAKGMVMAVKGRYPASEMKACLDSFYAPPIEPELFRQKISDIGVMCHITISQSY